MLDTPAEAPLKGAALIKDHVKRLPDRPGVYRDYIACLNDQPEWIAALSALAIRHLQGWPTAPDDAAERARQRDRAVGMGAAR
jgi:hypothetical protein